MGHRGEALASDEEEVPSDLNESLEERKATGSAAEHSGRPTKVEVANHPTSFAKRCHGETWDQELFLDSSGKACMVEVPAASGIYYQGYPRKFSRSEVQFSIPMEAPQESLQLWLSLRSSRIWRGTMHTKAWSHLGRGAWKPKACPKRAGRPKAKRLGRKRKALPDGPEGDELTATTRATGQDSDVEDDAGDSLSPRPVNGSNAVTPDAEQPGRAHPGHKRESMEVAVKPDPETTAAVQPFRPTAALPGGGYVAWLTRHLQLLSQRGKLNRSPDGCNPESGRIPGFTCAESNGTGQTNRKQPATSSSSGSAGKAHSAAGQKNGSAGKGKVRKKIGEQSYESDGPGPRRSSSPPTPRKKADGCRTAAGRQRSSSADGDRKSVPVKRGPGRPPKVKSLAAKCSSGSTAQDGRCADGSPQGLAAKQQRPEQSPGKNPGATLGKGPGSKQRPAEGQQKRPWGTPPNRVKVFPALVETDPFAIPEPKKQRLL